MGKGEEMRIQAINTNYNQNNLKQQQTNFKGFFMRVGTGNKTLTPNFYSSVAYIPFKDGNTKLATKTYKNKSIWAFPKSEITVEEGKAAYNFLFNKIRDSKAYEAAVKLRNFVESFSFDGEHNVMYIEKEDLGDPHGEWGKLELSDIKSELRKYEETHGIRKKASEETVAPKTYTVEELWEMIYRNGVA